MFDLGSSPDGWVALSADWPVYPEGWGVEIALISLCRFPVGTHFSAVGDSEGCLLLLRQPAQMEDPLDDRNLHVALWHRDMIDLARSGLATGVRPLTSRGWEAQRRDRWRQELQAAGADAGGGDPLEHLVARTSNGETVPLRFSPLDDYDDDVEANVCLEGPLVVTGSGWSRANTFLRSGLRLPSSLARRLQPLVDAQLYDSAIRDLGVAIETTLKEATGSTAYGARLIDVFIKCIAVEYRPASVRIIRSQLRTAFKFLRNEFAHNLVDLPETRGLALMALLVELYDLVVELTTEIGDPAPTDD